MRFIFVLKNKSQMKINISVVTDYRAQPITTLYMYMSLKTIIMTAINF